jgi:glycosyltransferase involved in cell wall biosynthesis
VRETAAVFHSREKMRPLMRILFSGYYYPFPGAATSRLRDFAQVLLERGMEVSVLSPITIRKRGKWMEMSNGVYVMRFFTISTLKVPIVGGLFNILSAFFIYFLMCRLRRPDVVVVSLPPGESPLATFMVCNLFKKPIVFDVRDEWEDYGISNEVALVRIWYTIMKKVYNGVYSSGRFCVAVNERIADHLMWRGIERVHVLPHSLDTSLFVPRDKTKTRMELGLSSADFIVVYAGIFQDYYRIDIVMKALHKIVFEKGIKNLKLLIIGSGPQMKEYVRIAKELKLSDDVYFVGLKPREKVAEFLGCSDAGVIPYDDNPLWVYPLPTKFHEYCSSGLPVIASVLREAILARYIKEWKVGLVVKPLSVDEMSGAIEFLYYQGEKAKEMGVNGRKLALTHFDREKITSKFLKLLATALK